MIFSADIVALFTFAGPLTAQNTSMLSATQMLMPPQSSHEFISGQGQLLKPSPSSENLYSAYTSEGVISGQSVSGPGPGKNFPEWFEDFRLYIF